MLQCLLSGSIECHFSSSLCSVLQILRDRLLDEAEASVQLNVEVASNWSKLFRYCGKCPCNALAADQTEFFMGPYGYTIGCDCNILCHAAMGRKTKQPPNM